MEDFEKSDSCPKCGSYSIEKKWTNTYDQGHVQYRREAEERLECKCDACGYSYETKTKDAE